MLGASLIRAQSGIRLVVGAPNHLYSSPLDRARCDRVGGSLLPNRSPPTLTMTRRWPGEVVPTPVSAVRKRLGPSRMT
jgi:hypothetical protein